MNQHTKIAILGGGGRTGIFLVNQLIAKGYSLKLLLRSPENFQISDPLIEIIKGDALDPSAIDSLLDGCQAVISTIGQRKDEPLVASQAGLYILDAMKKYGIKRYLVVAGLNLDTPFDNKSEQTEMGTAWMKANFPIVHADRQQNYAALSASDVDWTMVRVPLIIFEEKSDEIIVDIADCKGEKIYAADIAHFLIQELVENKYVQKAPFIANS